MTSLSLNRFRSHLMLALILALALAIFSGWRELGIDRANYIAMYDGIISNDEWLIRFWYAKDVLFLIAVIFSNYISDEPRFAFLIICIFSTYIKYLSIKRMGAQYTLPFIFLYAIFLSPGLEFAAMRGALAIGFFMLAIAYYDQKIRFTLLSAMAIMAHLSAALSLFLAIRQINSFLSKNRWGLIVIALGTSISAGLLLSLFPHGMDYENNQGTLLAYSEPLTTSLIALLVFYGLDKCLVQNSKDKIYNYLKIIRTIVYGLIAIAFGISHVVVTAATRYLEISWCLLLFAAIVMFSKSLLNKIGGLILLVFLSYINVVRMTWLAIANSNFT